MLETELVKVFENLNKENLSEEDIEELIIIFNNIKNDRIRNHISFIFSDLNYSNAIPHLLKKIFDLRMFEKNGSLVYSLMPLLNNNFIFDIIEILITQDYECRVLAFRRLIELCPTLDKEQEKEVLKKLNKAKENIIIENEYEESTLHYIEESIKIISEGKYLNEEE